MDECNSTYYIDSNGKCKQCQPPCLECTSINECKTCSTGGFLKEYSCTASSCPTELYYLFNNNSIDYCLPCLPECKACANGTNCIKCSSPRIISKEMRCLTNCPDGQFNDNSAGDDNAICKFCTEKSF